MVTATRHRIGQSFLNLHPVSLRPRTLYEYSDRSALAALGGSSVGALTPVLSNYVLQRSVTQRDLANREIEQRETLYADFIKEGSRLYANSITHGLDDIDELVALYSLALYQLPGR